MNPFTRRKEKEYLQKIQETLRRIDMLTHGVFYDFQIRDFLIKINYQDMVKNNIKLYIEIVDETEIAEEWLTLSKILDSDSGQEETGIILFGDCEFGNSCIFRQDHKDISISHEFCMFNSENPFVIYVRSKTWDYSERYDNTTHTIVIYLPSI